MPDKPSGEEIISGIQSKPPMIYLEAISFCPIASCLGEENNTHLLTKSFHVILESDKVSPEPPFPRVKPQFPQPLLVRLVL